MARRPATTTSEPGRSSTDPSRVRPEPAGLPGRPTTRFAPAPTGFLHLGHLVNAIYVWGIATATGGRVILRIEDHDRQRSRAAFAEAIVEDLEALDLAPDGGPFRQADDPGPYAGAVARLRAAGLAYACDCTRSTFAAWTAAQGRAWSGSGCPGDCRRRALPERDGLILRVAVGEGEERWADLLAGPRVGAPSGAGDLAVRDRHGNWTYPLCVVVDDLRQGIDLVIRGEDLLDSTAPQIRLARLLGRPAPPAFLHHPLLRRPGGAKLSKADGDSAIRDRLAAGASAADLLGEAAAAVGLVVAGAVVAPDQLGWLFGGSAADPSA